MKLRYRIYFFKNEQVKLELSTSTLASVNTLIDKHKHRFDKIEVQRIERFTIFRGNLTWLK